MSTVTFDSAAFAARYPEFASVPAPTLAAYFTEAGLYCNNTDSSPVTDLTVRSLLLNMLVAHIAQLNYGANGQAPSPLVGRLNQATEGTVSGSADMGVVPGNKAWFLQTKYGAAFWQASTQFRSAQFIPARNNAVQLPTFARIYGR